MAETAGPPEEKEEIMITLKCFDGKDFEVEKSVILQSQTITRIIEDCFEAAIPVPNVNSQILAKVIEYCNHHHSPGRSAKDLRDWDKEFMSAIDIDTLYDLFLAANYLDVKGLLDLCAQTVANFIKGKTVEEIRKTFNIKNDFTPEEEEAIREENQWAFE